MFCPNCGARNSEADVNCQKCGFNLKEKAGAKFKGTMLMMNNASAMAAELRRSAPAGVNPPTSPGAPPAAEDPAVTKPSLSPDTAKQMRAQLKGTMIGVAPPALGANKPPAAATSGANSPAMTVPRPSSRPPAAPLGAGPLPRQPGPGQVNAPGAGIHRGGGTIIGTGIAPTGLSPNLPPVAPPYPASPPTAVIPSAVTEALPVSAEQPFGAPGFGAPRDADAFPAFDRTHVSPSAPPAPARGVPEAGAIRSFESFPTHDPALSGTLIAGGSFPTGPSTELTPNVPQFAPEAGKRTNTPAMGVPTAYASGSASSPEVTDGAHSAAYGQQPSQFKVIALTVLTCGLYYVYQKFMAKNG